MQSSGRAKISLSQRYADKRMYIAKNLSRTSFNVFDAFEAKNGDPLVNHLSFLSLASVHAAIIDVAGSADLDRSLCVATVADEIAHRRALSNQSVEVLLKES